MFLHSISHFRAIAIIFIVSYHSFYTTGIKIDTLLEKTFYNLLAGGTILFVFISGFLFHHVFYSKFRFSSFINKKLKNVLIPYLILGIIPITIKILTNNNAYDGYFLPTGNGFIHEIVTPAIKYYLTGKILISYWYIPVIFSIFILSPLHKKFIEIDIKYQLIILFSFVFLALVIQRPPQNTSILQSIFYYNSIYLVGIITSLHRTHILSALQKKEAILLAAAIGIAFTEASLGHAGSYSKSAFEYNGIDLMLLQKIFLLYFFFIFLKRFDNRDVPIVKNIADTSFAIFFLHPFPLFLIKHMNPQLFKVDSWLFFLFFSITLLTTSLLLAKLIKLITPKYSRYITGY